MWGVCSTAAARPSSLPGSGDIEKRARVFFDVGMAYWSGTLITPRMGGVLQVRNDAVGVLGYRRVPLGFGGSFALSEYLALGARTDLGIEPRSDGAVRIRGEFRPFMQVFFGRDRNVRPFALLRGGVGRSKTFARVPGEKAIRDIGPMTWYPTLGAGLGTHVFITDMVSFDGMLLFDQRWNFVRPDAGVASDAVINTRDRELRPGTWTLRDGSLTATLTFGFSHWF